MLKTGSLEKLDNGIRHCRRCERCLTRMYAVPGEGSANARIVLFGEAPGKNEDITGRPFVGRAGKYLDKIFREHKVDREEIFITSILKCYHPKPPKKSQIVSCHQWAEQQIEVIQPRIMLVMGTFAAWGLFGMEQLGTDLLDLVWNTTPCIVTCHPAAAMRFPDRDKQFRRDFKHMVQKVHI